MLEDILTDYTKPSEYFYVFDVNKKQLANAFTNIGKVLANSEGGKIFALKVSSGVLSIRAGASIYYSCDIDMVSEEPIGDFEVTIWYLDVTKMLKNSKTVKITVSPMYVSLETDSAEINLEVSEAYVDKVPEVVGSVQEVQTISLMSSLKAFTSLNHLTSLFTNYNVVYAKGGVIQMKFPSVWVELNTHPIDNTFTLDTIKTIINFIGTATHILIHENQSYMVFQVDNEFLFIPSTEKASIQPIEEFAKDFDYVGRLNATGLTIKASDLLAVVGKTDASLIVYKNGSKIHVSNDKVKTNISAGECESNIVDKVNTRLEFLVNLLPILGSDILLRRKGHILLLESEYSRVIISTI